MLIREFPFTTPYPALPPNVWLYLHVVNPITHQYEKAYGLIDTGSCVCAIPGYIADSIGHNVKEGKPIFEGEGVGGPILAWEHQIEIQIFNPDGNIIIHTIPACPTHVFEKLSIVLLGVNNFLCKYLLQIHYPQQWFSIINPP